VMRTYTALGNKDECDGWIRVCEEEILQVLPMFISREFHLEHKHSVVHMAGSRSNSVVPCYGLIIF
jgi:hypothetical protein